MGWRKNDLATEVAELCGMGDGHAVLARVAKAVGAEKLGNHLRREAARCNVTARNLENGRCQFGHENCTAGDH